MSEKVSTLDVRQRLGDMLNRVALRHDEFIIERKGKPLAALVPLYRLEQMREFARQRALETMQRQKDQNPGLSDDAAMRLANEAKGWARRRAKAGKRQRGS